MKGLCLYIVMILPFAAMSQWVSSSIGVNGLSFRLASDGSVLDSANSAAIETSGGIGLMQKNGLMVECNRQQSSAKSICY